MKPNRLADRRRGLERGLAVIGAAALLIVGFDSLTYAATGSSLLLGRTNKEAAVTTVQNTGKGPALNLLTKSASTAPFSTNAKGLVNNLYAGRAATADKLGGLTLAQVQAAAKGATGAAGAAGAAGATGATGATGAAGAAGAPGPKGTARGFALISAAVAVIRSSGGVSVLHPQIGNYCVSVPGVDPSTSVAFAGTDYVTDGTHAEIPQGQAFVEYGSWDCGGFWIVTFENSGGTISYQDQPFAFMVP